MGEFVRESWPAHSEPLAGPAPSAEPSAEPEPAGPSEHAAPPAEAVPTERPKKRARGQNKARQFARTDDIISLCSQIARGELCTFGESCKYSHDLCAYLTHKRRDISFLVPTHVGGLYTLSQEERDTYLDHLYALALQSEQPSAAAPDLADPVQASLNLTTECPYFMERGTCPAGWRCRFLGAHVRRVSASRACIGAEAQGTLGTGLELVHSPERMEAWTARHTANAGGDEMNWLAPGVAKALRSKKYTYEKSPAITQALADETQAIQHLPPQEAATSSLGKGPLRIDYEQHARLARLRAASMRADASEDALEAYEDALRNAREGSDAAADTARVRPAEKRRLQWKGELYLAPLTTTGNLPFRRLCASFGSDIHCGEMGMAESFTSGHVSEWSLVRRWEGERIFGTQLCGAKPEFLVPAAEVLAREVGSGLDFVDVNCGCPIDLVYNKGAGSALLDHANKLGRIVRGMSEALGEVPLTIKLRTGTTAKQTTHKLFARAQTEWGVGGLTLHGRSRKQRYKNDADWAYIGQCVDALHASVRAWNEEARFADAPEMVPVPVYGNGDVYGWRDYYEHLESTHVDGAMIARGALIKPWIFTEIKERRDWDISSRERLDIVRQYASYGLTHWGADTQGVNTTRRFLCEMLSFTHRYVPLGVLEHVPVRMNDRPVPFYGRDPLETLLSSPSAQDWTRIADMFLGPAPSDWHFTPKHKSNAFDAAELQG
ncbi:tRNA-dihydrouridine(47) synthase [NAD(P)(+)] [Malassezia nana]|uniref:tRNA-dihydrouridine(47) synthase [NAD(P)(+)] n=1 Tax=Malassezia nana TaxID=180528 RepID=A0AAF0EJH9_9BASI|nr:tRNA-dihydrouridine(47) synthase [NAD(P)(+)] [Malassezia nana]